MLVAAGVVFGGWSGEQPDETRQGGGRGPGTAAQLQAAASTLFTPFDVTHNILGSRSFQTFTEGKKYGSQTSETGSLTPDVIVFLWREIFLGPSPKLVGLLGIP